jgi:hypothetical protein
MGDTGSLALGGALGAIAVATKHEIVLAIVGGLFVAGSRVVIIQVASFKADRQARLPAWRRSTTISRNRAGPSRRSSSASGSSRRKAGLWSGLDRPILVIVIFLMAIGIVLAFAASPAAAERAAWIDDPFYYLYRQLVLSRASGSPYWPSSSALSVTGVRRFAGLALVGSPDRAGPGADRRRGREGRDALDP